MISSNLNQYLLGIYNDNPSVNFRLVNYEFYNKFISLKYCVKLSSKNTERVVFNNSYFSIYTFSVENLTDTNLIVNIEISPDNQFFCKQSTPKAEIEPKTMDVFVPSVFLKYTALVFENPTDGYVYIYLQGQL